MCQYVTIYRDMRNCGDNWHTCAHLSNKHWITGTFKIIEIKKRFPGLPIFNVSDLTLYQIANVTKIKQIRPIN